MRADLGVPPTTGRTTSGLRREEVAYLAGVSITWYTWLEQGRDVTPSRQVLDSLARTLRLSHTEHVYLLALAGYGAPHPAADPTPDTVPADVARLLEALADFPAMAVTTDWTVLAWNAAYAAVYPNIAKVAVAERNFLWLLFTDPYLRTLIPDWEFTSMYNVASFRAEAGTRLDEPPFADLVGRLLRTSDAFRVAWESFDIDDNALPRAPFPPPRGRRPSHGATHPGALRPSAPVRLVIFTPTPATDTATRLRRLLDMHGCATSTKSEHQP